MKIVLYFTLLFNNGLCLRKKMKARDGAEFVGAAAIVGGGTVVAHGTAAFVSEAGLTFASASLAPAAVKAASDIATISAAVIAGGPVMWTAAGAVAAGTVICAAVVEDKKREEEYDQERMNWRLENERYRKLAAKKNSEIEKLRIWSLFI